MTAIAEPPASARTAFRIERQDDLAVIWFDLPGEKVNKFSSEVMTEFASIVDEMEGALDVRRGCPRPLRRGARPHPDRCSHSR